MGNLVLNFRSDDFAFVYSLGRPIGLIWARSAKNGRVDVLFRGDRMQFEVLRPAVVESRFGRDELQRLLDRFLPPPSGERTAG